MLDDAFKSVKAYLYERNSSPLLGSFVTSWVIWNYKTILLLFSDLKYNEKLDWIEKFYSTEVSQDILGIFSIELSNFVVNGIFFPALTAGFYLFIFPYPSRWVYHFSLMQQRLTSDLRKGVEQNQLLTLEESQKIRMDLAQAEKDIKEQFNASIDKKDREIELLKNREVELLEEIESLKSKDNELLQADADRMEKVALQKNKIVTDFVNEVSDSVDDNQKAADITWSVDKETEKKLSKADNNIHGHSADKFRNEILAYTFSNDNMRVDYLIYLLGNPKLVHYYFEKLQEELLIGVDDYEDLYLTIEGKDKAVEFLATTTKSYFLDETTMEGLYHLYPQSAPQQQFPQQPPKEPHQQEAPKQQTAPPKLTKMVPLNKEFKFK